MVKYQFISVAQSCPTLCYPMNCSTPGAPVYHQLPEFTQTHVHWVGDAIQPSHPLSSPSIRRLLPPSIFPSIRVFSSESVLRMRWPKYWSFSFTISPSSQYSGLISFRMDWLDILAVQGLSRVFFNTTVQKCQFFVTQLSLSEAKYKYNSICNQLSFKHENKDISEVQILKSFASNELFVKRY